MVLNLQKTILLALLTLFSFIQLNAQSCATVEQLPNINFYNFNSTIVAAINSSGWTGAGTGTVTNTSLYTRFDQHSTTQTFTQPITNANLKGQGATLTLKICGNYPGAVGTAATFTAAYNGTTYLSITIPRQTTLPFASAVAISYLNGATGSRSSMTVSSYLPPTSFFATVPITLPAGIQNNGNLVLTYTGTASSAYFVVNSVSFKSCPIVYTGNVYDDGNGMVNNLIDGTGTNVGGALQVGLYNSTGVLLTSTNVDATGNFNISYLGSGAYTLRLVGLPGSYSSSGEKLVSELPPSDGVPNGITNSITINDTTNNTDKPATVFGIDKLPVADVKIQAIPYPTGGTIAAGTITTAVSGTDLEDGTMGNGNSVIITRVPANATMLYNGNMVTVGQQILNFNPALLSFTGIIVGAISVVFNYSFVDGAAKSGTDATYTLNWSTPLPLQLISFIGTVTDNGNALQWQIADEINTKNFVVQRSADGVSFDTIATIAARVNGNNKYSYTDNNFVLADKVYYRLKITDIVQRFIYSNIIRLSAYWGSGSDISIYPNPVRGDRATFQIKDRSLIGTRARIINATGSTVLTFMINNSVETIDLRLLTSGYYMLQTDKGSNQKIIKE